MNTGIHTQCYIICRCVSVCDIPISFLRLTSLMSWATCPMVTLAFITDTRSSCLDDVASTSLSSNSGYFKTRWTGLISRDCKSQAWISPLVEGERSLSRFNTTHEKRLFLWFPWKPHVVRGMVSLTTTREHTLYHLKGKVTTNDCYITDCSSNFNQHSVHAPAAHGDVGTPPPPPNLGFLYALQFACQRQCAIWCNRSLQLLKDDRKMLYPRYLYYTSVG